jgi:hypothetical protein
MMKIKVENNGYGKHQWAEVTVKTNGGELKESSIDANSDEANDLILQFGTAMGDLLSMQLDKRLLTNEEIDSEDFASFVDLQYEDRDELYEFARAIEKAVRRKLGVE